MWRQERLTQTVAAGNGNKPIDLFYWIVSFNGLWVCEIIWCWWQISKWLWCIGRLILATDSWRTETNLSHCHSTTINMSQTDLRMTFVLTGFCLTACLSVFFCVLINLLASMKNHKPSHRTHKLIEEINTPVGLPLVQLLAIHSLRMHSGHNALHYHSHTALRNWWLCWRHIS